MCACVCVCECVCVNKINLKKGVLDFLKTNFMNTLYFSANQITNKAHTIDRLHWFFSYSWSHSFVEQFFSLLCYQYFIWIISVIWLANTAKRVK